MDYQEILDVAEQKLKGEYPEIISDLKECVASGSTGGEISSRVAYYLFHMKEKAPKTYLVLEKDINEYLSSCKKNGLYVI